MTARISRRSFVSGSAALGAYAALGSGFGAHAKTLAKLRGDELLPSPSFDKRHLTTPYRVGVRPHRTGGVRLEIDEAFFAQHHRYVIHNYGHGGAGITLSWGSASVVCELMDQVLAKIASEHASPRIAILGAGVIGLTTATELRRKLGTNVPITVYAKSADVRSTTSFVAGGQFEPSGIWHEYADDPKRKLVLGDLLRRSRTRLVGIQSSGVRTLFGVAERKNYTLDHDNLAVDAFTPADVVAKYRRGLLPFEKLAVVGREYSTWLMNPTILLPKLVADLREDNVGVVERSFATTADVLALPANVIVNCTGYGAKALFGDTNLVPQRGHLVVLQKTDPRQFYFFSGGCSNAVISYVFCRQDDVVVGGTVCAGEESCEIAPTDQPVFERIVANARRVFDGQPGTCAA